MKPSQQIRQMIKQWEGCRLSAYRCPAGVLTIGYGHTGADVWDGKTITRQHADELFDEDIEKFALLVDDALKNVTLKQRQYDAVVSLAYNIGIGQLRRSTLLKLVKQNPDNPDIAAEFAKWNKAGGKVLAGLTSRRRAEANHYFDK